MPCTLLASSYLLFWSNPGLGYRVSTTGSCAA